jgi:uncharacterized cupredoxin-like copper-binding protein
VKKIVKGVVVVAGIALTTTFGATAVAAAKTPTSTLTVQDGDSGKDGATIDSDGTQGSYKAAMDGTETGPIMDAVPQDKVKVGK